MVTVPSKPPHYHIYQHEIVNDAYKDGEQLYENQDKFDIHNPFPILNVHATETWYHTPFTLDQLKDLPPDARDFWDAISSEVKAIILNLPRPPPDPNKVHPDNPNGPPPCHYNTYKYHPKMIHELNIHPPENQGPASNRIIAHQGPLPKTHFAYKGSTYNVAILWENGERNEAPLSIISIFDPIACAIYAQKKNLLDMPG